ncbi:MAG: ATP/GTP-binding protein, partial [Actinomycetota bacterium]
MARAGVVYTKRSDRTSRTRPLKIVVAGPFSAGKTTLIKTISDTAIVGTERAITDGSHPTKKETTVAMDFGRINLGEDLTLSLFGTPGQKRFDIMWEVLSEGMLGFVLLIDGSEPRSVPDAETILTTFSNFADVPFVVGVSHLDEPGTDPARVLSDVRVALNIPPEIPV